MKVDCATNNPTSLPLSRIVVDTEFLARSLLLIARAGRNSVYSSVFSVSRPGEGMSSVDVSALLVDTAEAPVCIDVKGLSTDDVSGSPVGSAKSLVRNFVKEMSSIDLSGDLIGSEDSEFCIRSSGLRALP
jgi:hypothetical protein